MYLAAALAVTLEGELCAEIVLPPDLIAPGGIATCVVTTIHVSPCAQDNGVLIARAEQRYLKHCMIVVDTEIKTSSSQNSENFAAVPRAPACGLP